MVHFHHGHHGHGSLPASLNVAYGVAMALNLCFVAAETAAGFLFDSTGLLSDAGHKLTDVFSLVIALVAFRLAKSPSDGRFTYGYRKTSVLMSFFNACLLLAAVCVIVAESIEKIGEPAEINGAAVSWTAGAGILVSGASAFVLMRSRSRDINTKAAFLHMAADALVSVGVVLSGIIISVTGLSVIDPVISLVIAAVILFNTVKLLSESVRMLIDAVPDGVDYDGIRKMIAGYPGVESVSDLRIWPVSVVETALTAHLEIAEDAVPETVASGLHQALKDAGMDIVTLECKRKNIVR